MALHDFKCACGVVLEDIYRRADDGPRVRPERCPACAAFMEWIPQTRAMDVGGVKGAAFQQFQVDVDGTPQVIDSLHTLRRVERESEQRYRNGEGEPLRFRTFSQDRSNKDVGTFGTAGTIGGQVYDSGKTPAKKAPTVRHGEQQPQARTARGGGVTALKG